MRQQNDAMRTAIDALRPIRSKRLRAAIAPMADGRFPALRIAMRLRARNRDIDIDIDMDMDMDMDSFDNGVRCFAFAAVRIRADRRLQIGR